MQKKKRMSALKMPALVFATKRDFCALRSYPQPGQGNDCLGHISPQAAVSVLAKKCLSPCAESPRFPPRAPSPLSVDLLTHPGLGTRIPAPSPKQILSPRPSSFLSCLPEGANGGFLDQCNRCSASWNRDQWGFLKSILLPLPGSVGAKDMPLGPLVGGVTNELGLRKALSWA